MRIARTNYKKTDSQSNLSSKESQNLSSGFLDAQLPVESNGFVESLLDAVAAATEGRDEKPAKEMATPPIPKSKNIIELISEKQNEEEKSVLSRVKSELSDTMSRLRGRNDANSNSSETATDPRLIQSESSLIPVSIRDNIKQAYDLIQKMEQAILNFNISESDELRVSVLDSPKTESEKLLVDLTLTQHKFERSIQVSKQHQEPTKETLRAYNLINFMEDKLSKIPQKRATVEVLTERNPNDTDVKLPRTSLRNIAASLGLQVPESLSSSLVGSEKSFDEPKIYHAPEDSEIIEVHSSVSSPPSRSPEAAIALGEVMPPDLYQAYSDSHRTANRINTRSPASRSTQARSSVPTGDLLEVRSPTAPNNLRSGSVTQIKPVESHSQSFAKIMEPVDLLSEESPSSDGHLRNETGDDIHSIDLSRKDGEQYVESPDSAARTPSRRANRRLGNFTLKGSSPIRPQPPLVSEIPLSNNVDN